MSTTERPVVAVTGASSGIGAAAARLLAEAGFTVLAGFRDPAAGATLAQAHPQIEPIQLDVTSEDDVAEFGRRVNALPGGLAGLVNNAGIVNVGPLEGLPLARLREALDVNVIGMVAVTRAALPSLIRARGRIVNVGSPISRISLPMLGPYAASKAAASAINDTLRRELHETGVKVIEVTPGSVATPIFDKGVGEGVGLMQSGNPTLRERYGAMAASAIEAGRKSGTDGAPPEHPAAAIVRAMTARRPPLHHYMGVENRVVGIIARAVPARLADAVLLRVTRRRDWQTHEELQMCADAEAYFAEGSTEIIAPVIPAGEALWAAATAPEREYAPTARQPA